MSVWSADPLPRKVSAVKSGPYIILFAVDYYAIKKHIEW
jgi:hypothetical protein